MNPILSYILGVITLPALAAIIWFLGEAFSKNIGTSACKVCNGYGEGFEIGTRFMFVYWAMMIAHQFRARTRKHRRALGDLWRERTARNVQGFPWNDRWML